MEIRFRHIAFSAWWVVSDDALCACLKLGVDHEYWNTYPI